MGFAEAGVGLSQALRARPVPGWCRFADWPRGGARALLLALAALLVAAALVPMRVGQGETAHPASIRMMGAAQVRARPRDMDLKLYDTAIARIRRGENYYAFIVEEHRRANYPVRPGLAVRLPTLAYIDVALGVHDDAPAPLAVLVAVGLLAGVVWAWWQRLGDELGGQARAQPWGNSPEAKLRRMGAALAVMGASLGLNRYYFVLHELWAGMLMVLSLGLHRPGPQGRWRGAWLAAALALAIRELVLPYVLLMGALAFWRGQRREGAAWALLAGVFLAALAVHVHIIDLQARPSDPIGPSWLALRGLSGWLSNITLASNLRFLPHWVAGPLMVLMLFGWAAWRSPLGVTATLLYGGYALAFMIAGRNDNFYWGAVVAPGMFVGLAFAPGGLAGLWRAARGEQG